ncbi:MAG: two-component system sensor histidine kinase NtrB [Thermoanaerobaculia bacterium]
MDPRPHRPMEVEHRTPDIPTMLLYGGAVLLVVFSAYELLDTFALLPWIAMRALQLLQTARGVTASLLLVAFVVWYMVRHPTMLHRVDSASGALLDHAEWRSEHLRWFIQLRWIATAVAVGLILIAIPLTGILSPRQLPQLLACWLILVIGNTYFHRQLRRGGEFDRQVIAQTVLDLLVLTGMLNASGGIENPLVIAYLFHVIIAGILLPKRKAIGVAVLGSAMFCLLALGELFDFLPHVTILLFPHSHTIEHGQLHIVHAAHDPVFVASRVISFVGVMMVTAYFTSLVTDRLRRSEVDLEANAEKAMLERRRLEGVIDAARLGIAIIEHDLSVTWANDRLMRWLGWDERSLGGACPHDHRDGSGCLACAAEEALARGEQRETEIALPISGASTRFFRDVTSPVRDSDGRVVQAVAVVEDVTARKAFEAEALHSGRLTVLGQLAAGIAHEIGNPLSSLHARLQLMNRRRDADFQQESLKVLQTQIDRIGRIVRNVSHLSHNRTDGWTTIDVNSVVGEAMSLVKLDKRARDVRFSERLQGDLPLVRGVRDQILQVIINLLLNGVEAMPDGGALEAMTSVDGGRVKVAVSDTGNGIEERVRQRLFEPFFTTKAEGTGLGLSICYSLVHAHGGTIEVASSPAGSRFTVDLPAELPGDELRRRRVTA